MSCGTPSRKVSSGPAVHDGSTKTIGPQVSTATGNSPYCSAGSDPKPRRDGTSRSRPDRSHDQRWNGQRSSVSPEAAPSQMALPRCRQTFWNARRMASSSRTITMEYGPQRYSKASPGWAT